MRRQNGSPAGLQDHAAVPERRLSWRRRRRQDRGSAQDAPGTYPASGQATAGPTMPPASSSGWPAPLDRPTPSGPATSGETVAGAIQLAIAFLTAGLDSPELEAWAADTLTPPGADGLADLLAGLHVVSVLLLHELHEATEEPPAAILQRLALMAENRRGKPSAG